MTPKAIIEQAVHAMGAVNWLRYTNRNRARILMYHRFHGPAHEVRARVTTQCEHLRRHYHPVSVSEVAQAVQEGRALPPNALAITVDDGYRDFALAFPIFRAYGLKVTLYVVSEFADGKIWLWPDRIQHLVETTPLAEATVPLPGGESMKLAFQNPAANERAIYLLGQALLHMENGDRLQTLKALPDLLKTGLPAELPDRFAALSWDELRSMSRDGLDVGAHTRTHPILSKLATEAEMEDEIAGSKRRIEEGIGAPVRNFCYPNGRRVDIDAATVSWVKRAGFESAVISETGLINGSTDICGLPRVGVDPDDARLYFQRRVAGYRL